MQGMWVVHMVQVIVSGTADVLWMSLVRGMRGVGGICAAVQSLRQGLSTNPGVTMWCVCGCN